MAHTDRLTDLPEYQQALRSYRRWLAVATAAGLVLLASAAVAAARPSARSTVHPAQRNRDIILCLDVSGSMAGTDGAIVQVFERLAEEFDGERIGMVIFDSRAVQAFPLTDDYAYVSEQLRHARDAFDGKDGTAGFFDGTSGGAGSSLIGDGLASCVQGFPGKDDARRSRSVILATDNFVSGTPVFTLEQAVELASAKGVRIHALNPGDFDSGSPDEPGARLRAAAEATGGSYATPEDAGAVQEIVRNVQETEAASYRSAPQAMLHDAPELPLTAALVAGGLLLLAGWRLDS